MILVSGSLAYDRIMNFPGYFRDHLLPEKLHQISVSFFIPTMHEHFGGTAGNIAYSLALLGENPVILGSAGNDYGPYLAWQKKHGINVSKIRMIKDMPTAGAYIMTDKGDNQITAFHPGAMTQRVTCNMKRVTQGAKIAIVSPGNFDDMRALSRVYKKY
ncbi:MAG: PfkB family carbohydrate kinase, partial [bacterium]|nr:PfkB family carbohydrate kinase [bacterium]